MSSGLANGVVTLTPSKLPSLYFSTVLPGGSLDLSMSFSLKISVGLLGVEPPPSAPPNCFAASANALTSIASTSVIVPVPSSLTLTPMSARMQAVESTSIVTKKVSSIVLRGVANRIAVRPFDPGVESSDMSIFGRRC